MQDLLYLIVLSFMLNIRQIKHHLCKYGSDILPCIIMLAIYMYMYICIRVCTHFIFIIIKYATTILSCCMITPRFLHSPMITRNTNDQEIRSCHLKFTNCDWMAPQPNKLWCTCITSNNLEYFQRAFTANGQFWPS